MKKLVALGLFSISSLAFAETTKYVTDILYVVVRTGPSNEDKVLKSVRSGTSMVLNDAKPPQNGFVAITLADGSSGWVQERYLVDKPAAIDRVAHVDAKISSAEQNLGAMKGELETLKKERGILDKELKSERAQKEAAVAELSSLKHLSQNVLLVEKERTGLQEQVAKLHEQNEALRAENRMATDNSQNEGMKLGILAVLFGVLLGFVFPYIKPKQRRSTMLKVR